MNIRIFLVVILQILSVANSLSLTGLMKLRRNRLKRAFHNANRVGFLGYRAMIVTKIDFTGTNLFKFNKKVKVLCKNCETGRSRYTRWSKRFQ